MLAVDEFITNLNVVLAMTNVETCRLLAVVLDGFSYTPKECHNHEDVTARLSEAPAFAAVVDLKMDGAEEICELVREQENTFLVILIGEDDEDPEATMTRLGAEAWELADTSPERILTILRRLVNPEGGDS